MWYNVLGRTGLEVSRIGIGGIGTMGKYGSVSREEFAATMERASELRANFVDTAPAYSDSEAVFGYYLKDHRQNWTVCTKIDQCGDTIATRFVLDQCEQSLRRLCVDYCGYTADSQHRPVRKRRPRGRPGPEQRYDRRDERASQAGQGPPHRGQWPAT